MSVWGRGVSSYEKAVGGRELLTTMGQYDIFRS